MQREKNGEDNVEQDNQPESRSRAAKIIEERMAKRRSKASVGRLIAYIIALIVVLTLMILLRRAGL